MNSQKSHSNHNFGNNISEVLLQLRSLCNDVQLSWSRDCDQTNSMKEIIEIIKGMLVMSSLEEYFSNEKRDLDYFMGDFIKVVVTNILCQPIIYGENGDDIALDLLYHFVKLFMKFHKNKEYAPLFEEIRNIFVQDGKSYYNYRRKTYNNLINTKKAYTFDQFNQEFCHQFKKEVFKHFNVGDKVDILIKNSSYKSDLDKYSWVRGKIIDIKNNEYIVEYANKNFCGNKNGYPFDSPNIAEEGTKTEDWEWRLSLKKNDVVDCYDRSRWYPSTICDVYEKKEDDLEYKEYKIGFRLYPDTFLQNDDYNTFIQYTVLWDNNNGENTDKEGNTYYGDFERFDEELDFYSRRIQKFQKYSSLQKEVANNQMNCLYNSFNNNLNLTNTSSGSNSNSQNFNAEEKLKLMTEFLEKDKSTKNFEQFYEYEKNGIKNIVIGKCVKDFSYYYARLLKMMEENGDFETMINILKEKPTVDEINFIFFVLSNSLSYIHLDFFRENYNLFKMAFFNMMDDLSSKELRSKRKEVKELANNFFLRINHDLSINTSNNDFNLEDINLTLALKMLKSSIFDQKMEGLKTISDYIKTCTEEGGKKKLIDLIKDNDIIKEIFGPNYHTQIISKSNDILELMLKNNEITEEEIKLMLSLTQKDDLEAKRIIIQLISNLIDYLNEKYCNIILDFINNEEDKKLADNEIELIYNLAMKGNNEKYLLKYCEYHCKKVLEINNLNILEKCPFVAKLVVLFSKNEKYCNLLIDSCEKNIKSNTNILAVYYLLEQIVERYKNQIKINTEENIINEKDNNDFINNSIHKLIDNDNLLNLYKKNFLLYKKTAKEKIKENNYGEKLIIEGYTHEENMKNRVLFLIKIISLLYPKLDFFGLLKEICIDDPVYENDKLFFYDFMKKYITENNWSNSINSNTESNKAKEYKIMIQTQLFDMLDKEKKSEMNISQFNLFIEIFLNINSTKELLSFKKNANDGYDIVINKDVSIDNIFRIDKLWDLLFELKKGLLTKRLIVIFYNLYKNKDEIQKLLDKCVNIIKDIQNITYNQLEKCIKILEYIILESEKEGFIEIKPHFGLLKDCIINIPLEFSSNTANGEYFMLSSNSGDYKNEKEILVGNMTLMELKQILIKKHNLDKNNMVVSLSYKENNSIKKKELDSTYNNKLMKEILDIENNFFDNEQTNKRNSLNSKKIIYTGEKIKSINPIQYGRLDMRYEKMIKEWFINFSTDNVMDKDNIMNYVSVITSNPNADTNNDYYKEFMKKCDPDQKNFILEDEFVNYYEDLAKNDWKTVTQHIKIMNYRVDFKKNTQSSSNSNMIINNKALPRYILGNDKQFHDALIELFKKFDKKAPIYNFLFFLSTNEKKYHELINDFNTLFNDDNNKDNYLEVLYKFIIMESFIEDLEIPNLDLNQLFNKKSNQKKKKYQILFKSYLSFDDEKLFSKKKSFLIDFIEKKGYEKMITFIENLLDIINNNNDDEQIEIICCKKGLKLINNIYNSYFEKQTSKNKNKKYEIYYLNNEIRINNLIDLDKENNENNKKDELKKIISNVSYIKLVTKIITFLYKSTNYVNQSLHEYCFKLLIDLITTNELLSNEIKKSDDIKKTFTQLIKNNIHSPITADKFFIESLIKYLEGLSSNIKDIKKLDFEFLLFLFDISNSIFRELVNNNENKENNVISYKVFFEFFSDLFKVILNKNNYNNNNKNNENEINMDLSNKFIVELYELLYKDIKEEDKNKKLSQDTFLGFMKILITAIKNNKSIKKEIINKKINNETLLEIIYDKIYPEKDKKNKINEIKDNDFDIQTILNNMNEIDNKFIPMEKCDIVIKNFNMSGKKQKDENLSQTLYDTYNDFILACLSNSIEPELIRKLVKIIEINKRKDCFHQNAHKNKMPKRCGHVGLKNNGCICYMNSILQQMYMVPSFRYAILSADDKKDINNQISSFNNNIFDDNLLHQIQKMYTFLTFSEKQAYNPKDFCSSFKDFDGESLNPLIQQDSQDFFTNFCDKIENSLKDTKYKYIINNIFTGKTCSSVICEKCNTVSNRFEDFYNLSLEVKNIGNLYESLQKMIAPEKIEQFNCEVCKEKVTISKRTSLAKLPNVLFVHLKRFYMNYENELAEKINSKFEFPNTLNLKQFCVEEIIKKNNLNEANEIYPKEEYYYEYELKGINIHIGSAQGGHYVSFIDVERDGHNNELNIKSSIENNVIKTKWLKFNDSIVSEFDTKDIPIESFGGYVDNNLNNEQIQNAYLLIYERKKKTPIKIVLDKDECNNLIEKEKDKAQNYIISFKKEQKDNIEKLYDISYSKKSERIKNEEELYKLIFKNEETNECYSYIPYYNIEKMIEKEHFIEVMNKNKKRLSSNNNIIYESIKTKTECYEILFNIINLKEFNILNDIYTLEDKKKFLNFVKEKLFNYKLFSNQEMISINNEEKIMINDRTPILLNKLVLPIVNAENKEENNELIKIIFHFIVTKQNLKRIFESNQLKRGFDKDNIKKFSDIIYTLMSYLNNTMNLNVYFGNIYDLEVHMCEDNPNYMFSNVENSFANETFCYPLYYFYQLIYKLLPINQEWAELLVNKQQISNLLGNINQIQSIEIKNTLYDLILYLLDYYSKATKKNENNISIRTEKNNFKQKLKSKKLQKLLFVEKFELYIKLLKICQYNDKDFTENYNKIPLQILINKQIKSNRLKKVLDAFIEFINIKDDYTLDRLYLIMGVPEEIIYSPKPIKENNNNNNKSDDDSDDSDEEKQKPVEVKVKNENENENEKFWPLFGVELLKDPKSEGEIYKYVNNIQIYETHCLLAQLFPCTKRELYSNLEFIEEDEILTEEDRYKYIYKLISTSLLGKGNYCLFKYIYLTPSRFAIKYNNLYEEIIDILSNQGNFDLSEIKENAEIYIERINYEVKKTKDNLSKMINKKIDSEDENDDNDNKIMNNNGEELKEEKKDEIPASHENMANKYKTNDEIEEFSGFLPTHLPDTVVFAAYNIIKQEQFLYLLMVNYYTTFQNIKIIKKNEEEKEKENKISNNDVNNEKINKNVEKKEEEIKEEIKEEKNEEKEKEQNKIDNKNKINIIKEEEKKEDNKDYNDKLILENDEDNSDEEMFNKDINSLEEKYIYDVNQIQMSEDKFLKKISLKYKEGQKIILINKSLKKKVKVKLGLIRYILYNYENEDKLLRINMDFIDNSKGSLYNCYLPNFTIGYSEHRNCSDITKVYRRNKHLNFVRKKSLNISANIKQKSEYQNENYLSDWNGYNDFY